MRSLLSDSLELNTKFRCEIFENFHRTSRAMNSRLFNDICFLLLTTTNPSTNLYAKEPVYTDRHNLWFTRTFDTFVVRKSVVLKILLTEKNRRYDVILCPQFCFMTVLDLSFYGD